MNFGELTDEATSLSIMDEALAAGINFFDTADVYGGPQSPDMEKGFGISEEIIGRWLAQGGRRDRIVLAMSLRVTARGSRMSEHRVTLKWQRAGAEFTYQKYPRDHIWSFDGGHTMAATAADLRLFEVDEAANRITGGPRMRISSWVPPSTIPWKAAAPSESAVWPRCTPHRARLSSPNNQCRQGPLQRIQQSWRAPRACPTSMSRSRHRI
jgi:Aldo/keto reductase family